MRIECTDGEVVLQPRNDAVLSTDDSFENGVIFGVSGRGELEPVREGRRLKGFRKRGSGDEPAQGGSGSASGAGAGGPVGSAASAGSGAGSSGAVASGSVGTGSGGRGTAPSGSGASGDVRVVFERVVGFATVLDFDADLSAVGILPIKVTLRNNGRRSYDFDPTDIRMRVAGSRDRRDPLSIEAAVQMVDAGAGGSDEEEGGGAEIGDISAAKARMRSGLLSAGRLSAGTEASGYLFYEKAEFDRARITLTDVATGETEGFLVEF